MADPNFSLEERKALLNLARYAIEAPLKPVGKPPAFENTPALCSQRGAFVTIKKQGGLRGCIGTFVSSCAVTQTVQEMAQAAAFEDPRFPPLRGEEIPDIDLEISVLTPMQPVKNVEEIEVGKHGIYIVQGRCRGVLLPQVATENCWDRKTFLEQTCCKAGLNPNCWKEKGTQIFIFSAEIFGEKEED